MPSLPLIGLLAIAGRTIGLGTERPLVKALGQGRNSFAATTLFFGISELLLLPFVIWHVATNPAYLHGIESWILQALVTGVIYAVSYHCYVWALSKGEVSYLTPLFAASFIWLYALDVMFGDAALSLIPIIGILTVSIGIIILNIAPGVPLTEAFNPLTVLKQAGALGMLIYAFGLATCRMIDDSAASIAPPLAYAFINGAPTVIAGVVILGIRKETQQLPKLMAERPWIAILCSLSGAVAYILLLVAMDYFNPSVIEPVAQLSVLISVWLGALMFKEKVSRRFAAALLVVAGALLLLFN